MSSVTKISPGAVCQEGDKALYEKDRDYDKPEVRLGSDFLIRSSPRHACEDTLIATEETGLNILNMFRDAVEQFNGEEEGSTLTIAELDKEGNLKFGILGDSPVYLIVKDKAGVEKVIKLSEDMDMIPGKWDKNNTFLRQNTRYSQYGIGEEGLAVAGAIGDAYVREMYKNNILSVPEYYDFSKGEKYTVTLNTFLKRIGVKGDINDLLKNGVAKVVVGSDGLESSKLAAVRNTPRSVHDYELRFADKKDFLKQNLDYCIGKVDKLPPGNISFDKCKDKKVNTALNPILSVSKLDKLTAEEKEALKNPEGDFSRTIRRSRDDILLYNLKPGFTVALADGHGLTGAGVVSGGIMDLFEKKLDTCKKVNDIKVTENRVGAKSLPKNQPETIALLTSPLTLTVHNRNNKKEQSKVPLNIHNMNNTPCNAPIQITYNLHYGKDKTLNTRTKSDGINTHKNLEAESSKIGTDIKALDKESFLAEFREKFIDNTSYYATKLLKTLQKNDKPLHEIFKHSSRLDYLKDDPEKELELKNECIALLSKKVQLFETSYTHDRF